VVANDIVLSTSFARRVLVAGLALATLLSGTAHASDWAAGRAGVQAYEAEKQATATALEAGDMPKAEAHAAAAREHLRAAQTAFESEGILTTDDAAARAEYRTVLRTLGYHDLLAEVIRADLQTRETAADWLALGQALALCGPNAREEARAAFNHALAPGEAALAAPAHAGLADLYYADTLPEFARKHYEAAIAADAADTRSKAALAALKVADGDLLGGAADIDALGRDAQPHDAFIRARLREALALFELQRRSFPDTLEYHRAYARTLYRAARTAEAAMAARRVLDLDPKDTTTWNFLAAMLSQLGQHDQALKAYEGSLAADPNQPQVVEVIANLKQTIERKVQPTP
jgi:tetratricopeptide (TPR) repeat protein